jgi:hypothetical protein
MQIKELNVLEIVDSQHQIQGAGRPYANVAADGIAVAGSRVNAGISGGRPYYEVSSAVAVAVASAVTLNGPASVSIGVSIRY